MARPCQRCGQPVRRAVREPEHRQVASTRWPPAGLAPHRLEFEITESVLLQDESTKLATLHQLAGRRGSDSDGRFRHRLFFAQPICAAFRSTRSRSITALSTGCRRAATPLRSSRRSPRWRTASSSRSPPKASRPNSNCRRCVSSAVRKSRAISSASRGRWLSWCRCSIRERARKSSGWRSAKAAGR